MLQTLNNVKTALRNKFADFLMPALTSEDQPAVIDPEDYHLNTIINERGYTARLSLSAEKNNIDMGWVEDVNELPLLFCSLDQLVDKKTGLNTYGIRVNDLGNAVLVSFVAHTKTCYFHVWADNTEICNEWLQAIQDKYFAEQELEVFDENTNTRVVSFWGASGHGYDSFEKKIVMLNWDEHLDANYPKKVRQDLQVLHDLKPPILGGRIILMHGSPGTGKTSLIRTLATHWTKWCHISIITDPEVLFGSSSALMTVLQFDYSRYIDKSVPEDKAYHMIVIEDAGELLEKDAHGQGFSRLLNMADGMLGQSTNLIVCITTNKDIHQIHDAISRPGRCIANVYFEEFEYDEAKQWLQDFDTTDSFELYNAELTKLQATRGSGSTYTLAELYHVVSSSKQIIASKETVSTGQYL